MLLRPLLKLCLLLLPGVGVAQPVASEPLSAVAPAPGNEPVLDYSLGPGDLVGIRVLGEPDLSSQVRIGETGQVDLPVLGTVRLGGLSTLQAADALGALLGDCCLKQPDVVVQVNEYGAYSIEVLGNVGKSGPITLTRPTRLLEVLSRAEGLGAGSASEAVITSADGSSRQTVDLHALLEQGRMEFNLLVRAGDVVFVPRAVQVSVTGEVKSDSAVPWTEGLTVVQAISLAGGLSDNAAAGRVQVIRTVDDRQQVFRVNLRRILRGRAAAFVLEAEDTVWVPRSAL